MIEVLTEKWQQCMENAEMLTVNAVLSRRLEFMTNPWKCELVKKRNNKRNNTNFQVNRRVRDGASQFLNSRGKGQDRNQG